MLASPLPIHLGPGVEPGPLDGVLSGLGLAPVRLEAGSEPESPALFLVTSGSVRSLEQLGRLARGGAVVVIHPPGAEPPPGWDADAIWVPEAAPAAVLAAALRMARANVTLKLRVAELEAGDTRARSRMAEMNRIGIALSSEQDMDTLQDLILKSCRQLTNADAATLYLVEEAEDGHRMLRFAWTQTASIHAPFSTFKMPLVEQSIAGYTVITGRSQMVADAYDLPDHVPFGFNRSFDEQHGYRSKSMLCVPMSNHDGEIVGAIQLINAKLHFETELTPENVHDEVVGFEPDQLELIQSIASQAAVALDNKNLIDAIQNLFEGFVKASVTAIESRDPTTYGHSGRVAALTVGLAEAVNGIGSGRYADANFDAEQLKEIRYAGLLHDFGKVGVREHVLVKEKKLYPANMDLLRARFAFVQRSIEKNYAERKLTMAMRHELKEGDFADIDRRLQGDLAELRAWLEAVVAANEPSVLPEDKASTLAALAEYMYEDIDGKRTPILLPDEFHFLSIRKGTLDEVERLEIESHVTHSFKFLIRIPWTPAMRNVPQYAYGHHELLDGSGYPRKLQGPEIPAQARMMTISDIFDALTATDRPYKRAVPVDRALDILHLEFMGKLDADLLDIFIAKKVYELAASYRPDAELLLGGGR
ncbi:MAG: HD family phosphohydrolase [Candidatus Dormibacteraceae bacterium]